MFLDCINKQLKPQNCDPISYSSLSRLLKSEHCQWRGVSHYTQMLRTKKAVTLPFGQPRHIHTSPCNDRRHTLHLQHGETSPTVTFTGTHPRPPIGPPFQSPHFITPLEPRAKFSCWRAWLKTAKIANLLTNIPIKHLHKQRNCRTLCSPSNRLPQSILKISLSHRYSWIEPNTD